jgi:hypothetical protein
VTTVWATINKSHLRRPQKPVLAGDVALDIKKPHLWSRFATHHHMFSPSMTKNRPQGINCSDHYPPGPAAPSQILTILQSETQHWRGFAANHHKSSPIALSGTISSSHLDYQILSPCFAASDCFAERNQTTISSSHRNHQKTSPNLLQAIEFLAETRSVNNTICMS